MMEERPPYATRLGSALALYNEEILNSIPTVEELVLYLLFMRQYLKTDHNK